LGEWLRVNPNDFERLEDIRQGNDASCYMLPGWATDSVDGMEEDRLVNLGRIYSVPVEQLQAQRSLGQRVGLVAPVREHFSQAVARSLMRVALDDPIPRCEWERSPKSTRVLEASSSVSSASGTAIALQAPLEVSFQAYRRAATDQSYVVARTPKGTPGLVGVGRDDGAALVSLVDQALLRVTDFYERGEQRWAWVVKIFASPE
jgi:hypothetical protein